MARLSWRFGSGSRPAKAGYYDGALYARFVESVSRGMLELVAEAVPSGSRLIDLCCGTGALALLCAARCEEVLGVDISPAMIEYAGRQRGERENVHFRVGDASALPDLADGGFDWATLVMGLHEMPGDLRPRVLAEAARLARTLLVVDFLPRMPWNPAGLRNRCVEVLAGPRHFRAFVDFSRRGGLSPLFDEVGLTATRRGLIDGGSIEICTLTHA